MCGPCLTGRALRGIGWEDMHGLRVSRVLNVDEIGEWFHSLAGGRASHPKTVWQIVATEPIWDRSELSRDELTARIIANGRRIGCAPRSPP